MKALSSQTLCLAALLLTSQSKLSAQTFIYNFSAPTMKVNGGNSGLAVGSVWVYSKIDAAATTDAVVKITNSTGGLSLSTFDQDNIANGGYTQAFQPTISVPSGTSVNGYIEFSFTFIKTGTYSTSTQTGTALPQTSVVPATVLDDDGTTTGGTLNEYDVLNLGTGEAKDYDASGGQLSYSTSGSYITGTNVTGTNYPGISTSATAVMFTVINTNISSLIFRTGVISDFTTTPAGRVSSLAFFMPTYPNSVLASSPIGDFHGTETANTIHLNWQLVNEQSLSTLNLERSIDNNAYQLIGSFQLSDGNIPNEFTDANLPSGTSVGYRLKAATSTGSSWYSNVIDFKLQSPRRFSIGPNPVLHTATVNVTAVTSGSGVLQLMDYTGRIISRQQTYLNQGSNNLYFQRPAGLPAGVYIVIMQTGRETFMEKIMLAGENN